MKTLKVYGASDDLIEASGVEGCGEFSAHADGDYQGHLTVESGNTSQDYYVITLHVIHDGCWAFAVTMDEDNPPNWPVRRFWGKDIPYSETLEIDVPDDARLSWAGVK
jgi:hypothetical protein